MAYYTAINKITPEVDGVSLMDLVIALFYYQNTLKERLMTEKEKEDAAIAERMQKLGLSEAVREALAPVIDEDVK